MTWSLSIPILTSKRETKHTHTMYMHIHDTHFSHIYVNTGQERVFIKKSFLFNIQNKSFHDIFISLV